MTFFYPRRKPLVVPEEDEIGSMRSKGLQKISTIAGVYVERWEFSLDGCHAHRLILYRCSPFYSFNISILRNDDDDVATFHRFTQDKAVPLMEEVEGAEDHHEL